MNSKTGLRIAKSRVLSGERCKKRAGSETKGVSVPPKIWEFAESGRRRARGAAAGDETQVFRDAGASCSFVAEKGWGEQKRGTTTRSEVRHARCLTTLVHRVLAANQNEVKERGCALDGMSDYTMRSRNETLEVAFPCCHGL